MCPPSPSSPSPSSSSPSPPANANSNSNSNADSNSNKRSSSSSSSSRDPDPHNIEWRFVGPQKENFANAIQEIKNGYKESCWSWFMLPTAPYIVDGVERGSYMNREYALRGDDAVEAYLTFQTTTTIDGTPINLRSNYLEIVSAMRDQLRHNGLTLSDIMGDMDDRKAISSFRLFERIGRNMNDKELYHLCGDVLELCGERRLPAGEDKNNGDKKKGIRRVTDYFSKKKVVTNKN